MPQLVKGGKYIFGWSCVHPDGRIMSPPEAREEYCFEPGGKLIVMSCISLALAFLSQGPIIEEASKHMYLEIFK